jgi:hypothetical protein
MLYSENIFPSMEGKKNGTSSGAFDHEVHIHNHFNGRNHAAPFFLRYGTDRPSHFRRTKIIKYAYSRKGKPQGEFTRRGEYKF